MVNAIRHLNIEIARKCNQRCFYCFNNSGEANRAEQLSFSTWMNILAMMRQWALRSILVTGGEPFIWPKIIDLLYGAQELGLETSVLSNGFRVPKLAQEHSDVFRRLTVAQISLDSMNPVIHDVRRGIKGAWQDAVDAIECLHKFNVPVEISCTVSDGNLEELIAVGEYTKSVGAKLLIRPLAKVGRASTTYLSPSFRLRLNLVLELLRVTHGVEIVTDRFLYAPITNEIDIDALQNGILTIEPSGKFRYSFLSIGDGLTVYNAIELLKAA